MSERHEFKTRSTHFNPTTFNSSSLDILNTSQSVSSQTVPFIAEQVPFHSIQFVCFCFDCHPFTQIWNLGSGSFSVFAFGVGIGGFKGYPVFLGVVLKMGALDEGHFCAELENEVNIGSIETESETETLAIVDAVKVLLQGLGEDISREGIKKTPLRVAKALRDGTRGYRQNSKDIVQSALFPEAGFDNGIGHAGGVGGLVVVRDIDLFSYCESCLLPFQVKCHVGYIPSGKQVVGLSKVARVADVFAKRLQDPQRLADEVCSALHQGIKPAGVAVILQCSHIHFPNSEALRLDSNHRGSVKLLVYSGSGGFEDEEAHIWTDFLSLLRFRGINLDAPVLRDPSDQCWCPARSSSSAKSIINMSPAQTGMVNAVTSILKALGEDPSRKELLGTPYSFVKWLTNFEKTNLDMKVNGTDHGRINCYPEKEMHTELNLSFWSLCEHHLLPFHGVVHIGYFSAKGAIPIGKSLFQSIVHLHGFKLQVQERLTRQIAETVSSLIGKDVMVVVEANHTCMISRGVEKFGSSTATIAVLGQFSTDPATRAMFLQGIPKLESSDE